MTSLAELGMPSTYEDYQYQQLRKQMAAANLSRQNLNQGQKFQPGSGFSALELFPSTDGCQCAGCMIYPRMMSLLGVLTVGQMMVIVLLLSRRSQF